MLAKTVLRFCCLLHIHLSALQSTFHILPLLLLQPLDNMVKRRGDDFVDLRLCVVVDMLKATGEVSFAHVLSTSAPPLNVELSKMC